MFVNFHPEFLGFHDPIGRACFFRWGEITNHYPLLGLYSFFKKNSSKKAAFENTCRAALLNP